MTAKICTIDIGNTNVVFGIFENGEITKTWRFPTHEEWPAPQKIDDISKIIIGSVVPKMDDKAAEYCQKYFTQTPAFATAQNIPVKNNLANLNEAGADRLINAAAVIEYYQTPAIVIDFGTATTFDVINGNNVYEGGVIAPGVRLSAKALEQAAAKLPEIKIEKPQKVIANETQAAMQSGIYYGYIGLIENIVVQITREMGAKPFIIGTGGLAPFFETGTNIFDTIDGTLTLKGLYTLHDKI